MIKYLSTKESKPLIGKILDLARTKFPDELMYDLGPQTLKWWDDVHTLCSVAYDTETENVLSYCTWTVSDLRFRDGLLSGELDDNDIIPYDETSPAVLFLNVFVVTDAHHSPPIIHRLCNDLKQLIVEDQLNIVGGMAIGGLRLTENWLKKFGFHEIGKYKDQYPILYGTREDSLMLNSICSTKGSVTSMPWRK